jgi:GAF domain-containing protein
VATVGGCDHVAISITRRRVGLETVAATDEVPPRVDALQCETGEGPCWTGAFEHEICRIDDLAGEERWPAFCRRAVEEIGVRSMLSFPLCTQGDTTGVMNLYGRRPAAFDVYSHAVGRLLAAHAAIALSAVREQERADNLEDALRSSREIGMAIGVRMGRDTMTGRTRSRCCAKRRST